MTRAWPTKLAGQPIRPRPVDESELLYYQADTAAYYGRTTSNLHKLVSFPFPGKTRWQAAERAGRKEGARRLPRATSWSARRRSSETAREAEAGAAGQRVKINKRKRRAVCLWPRSSLAMVGDKDKRSSSRIHSKAAFPDDTIVKFNYLPTIYGADRAK